MFKRIFFLFLCSIIFSSCVFFVSDSSRAVHPVVSDVSRVVYVHTSGTGNAANIYRTGSGTTPIWCDVDKKYADFLLDGPSHKKMFAVCYSNKKPPLQEDLLFPNNEPVQRGIQGKGPYSIEEFFNPFSRAYIFSLSITPSRYDDFFIFYFDLYRKFCLQDGVSCCMTGDGNNFKFSMVVEEPESVKQFYMDVDAVVNYANKEQKEYQNISSLYGLFSSVIYDKCSFNRWYYDAVSSGVMSPEFFMDSEKWTQLEGKTMWSRVKKINVKLIDYQKVSSEDKSWLDGSLKNLTERL